MSLKVEDGPKNYGSSAAGGQTSTLREPVPALTTGQCIGWIIACVIQLAIGGVLGWAVNGAENGFWAPLFSFGVQWVAFVPCYLFHTEKLYDLIGSFTYQSLSIFTLLFVISSSGEDWVAPHPRQIISTAFVLVWAIRLGWFLFARVLTAGEDARFKEFKYQFLAFFGCWNLQGLWVYLTGLSVWAVNSRNPALQQPLGALDAIGIVVWVVGFGIEVVADRQKKLWRADPSNKGRYIDVGLWRYSRHPNYFGEWFLWVGQFVLCSSSFFGPGAHEPGAFNGSGFLCALSPIFVYLLLNYVSGVPMLETGSDQRWGHEPAYQAYKKETWVFFLLPVRRTAASDPAPPDQGYA